MVTGEVRGERTGLDARIVVRRSEAFEVRVEFDAGPGETVALLGPNGAGKSTVLAALAGLLPLDAGRIELDGRVLDDPGSDLFVHPEDRRVGVVFQDARLFPHLRALDDVAFGPRARGTSGPEAERTARRWLEATGVADLADRRPGELSGGQRQRVALARALAAEPAFLLLDEPLSALDVRVRAEIRALLATHLRAFDGPRVVVTHDPDDAFALADRIVVVEEGRGTQVGSPDEIRLRPATPWIAEFAGTNLVSGDAVDGVVEVGNATLVIGDPTVRGPVRLAIRPQAIALHRDEPSGSPRNRWKTSVRRVEARSHRLRVLTGDPLPLVVEVTGSAATELALAPGAEVWLSVKASEIGVEPV